MWRKTVAPIRSVAGTGGPGNEAVRGREAVRGADGLLQTRPDA